MNKFDNLKCEFDTGITSEVFTIKSKTYLIDIINFIIQKKAEAVFEWINKFYDEEIIQKDDSVVVIGTYLTGVGIAKLLFKEGFSNITLLDIYPHLEEFIDSKIAYNLNDSDIKFSSDFNIIKDSEIIIDTTGFGGLSEEFSSEIHSKLFLIEDPVAEDIDGFLNKKNNIIERLDSVSSDFKAILKTEGLNTKTSGTMTFLINVLKDLIVELNNKDGVLYAVCEMAFFEEIIFKEKNISKFLNLIDSRAIAVSTIIPFDCDVFIKNYLNKIDSIIIDYKV